MAQTRDRSQVRAGIFIVVSVALVFGVVVGIKGVKSLFTPVDERRVRFSLKDNLGGLRIGDDVRLGGFKVGAIKAIDFDGLDSKQGGASILVTFSLPKKYPLRMDSQIAVESELTGSSNLNITSLGVGDPLPDKGELKGSPSTFSALTAEFGDIGPRIKGVVAKAGDTLTSIRNASDQMGELLGDTKPDLRGTIANLNSITTETKGKLPGMLQHFDETLVSARGTIDDARKSMEDIRATVANTKTITADARNLISGNKTKFDNIVSGLKASSDNLKGATAEIRRSPWRALYHPGPGEMDNLELYDAARQFAEGANSVEDAAGALKDALNNPAVDKEQVAKLVGRLNETFGNFNTVEQKLWKAVKPE